MPTPARKMLRDATADWHERVDQLFAQVDLANPVAYGRFLAAHAEALLPLEQALDEAEIGGIVEDWPLRRRGDLILKDLADLDLQLPPLEPPPSIGGSAAAIGAIYVLEGSRLGGSVLARQVGTGLPKRYLAGERQAKWQPLLALIDRELSSPERLTLAIITARAVFASFERGGKRHLQ